MREFIGRLMADRMAWFWMLAEPILFVLIMIWVRAVIMGRDATVANAEFIPWLVVGLLGFFLVRENLLRLMTAVEANSGLFAYRQVKPVDTVLVRGYLEGVMKTVVLMVFILGGILFEIDLIAHDFLYFAYAWMMLWALGLGLGLCSSVLNGLVPEIGKIIRMMSLPLLILSGVIIPLHFFPYDVLQYLMYNPIVHGLEMLRDGMFERYYVVPGTDPLYLWYWVLGANALGLMLHLRFEMRLKAK